jgi:hypothetical protein
MITTRDTSINELWVCADATKWNNALKRYWDFVKPGNLKLERELENLTLDRVRDFSPSDWYSFLLNEYYRWKYTAPNRYASTTTHLKKWKGKLEELDSIRRALLAVDLEDPKKGLAIAVKIPGLGVAGASGLLALLYPDQFGTVDQFVVRALRDVAGLPELERLERMNPENLSQRDGVLLIGILRRKAAELNETLQGQRWTPRMVEMVLWTYGRG